MKLVSMVVLSVCEEAVMFVVELECVYCVWSEKYSNFGYGWQK